MPDNRIKNLELRIKGEKDRGFTLIELLIAVSIVAILSLIGLVAYSIFLKSARDAKRQTDLRFIQSALEQYHADQKFYPPGSNSCSNGRLTKECPLKDENKTKVYLNSVPKDPKSPAQDYLYQAKVGLSTACDLAGPDCDNYCLWAKLENTPVTPLQPTTNCSAIPPGGYNFLITPP